MMAGWAAPSKNSPGDSSHRAEGGSERVVSTNEVQLLSSEA